MTDKRIRSFYLPAELIAKLERRAQDEDRTPNRILTEMLRREFGKVRTRTRTESEINYEDKS